MLFLYTCKLSLANTPASEIFFFNSIANASSISFWAAGEELGKTFLPR